MSLFDLSGVICRVRREDEETFLWREGVWDPVEYPANSCFWPIVRVVVEGCPYMESLIGVGSLHTGGQ